MMKLFRHLLFVALLAPFGAYAATVDVWFSAPSSNSIAVGDTFSIDILVGNYSSPNPMGAVALGGAIDLSFDPSILSTQAGMGTPSVVIPFSTSTSGSDPGVTSESLGTITSISNANSAGFVADPFLFATINLVADATGISTLVMSDANSIFYPWADNVPDAITPNFIDSSVTVVPLPAAAWLMLSGLAACGFLGRRKAIAATPATA